MTEEYALSPSRDSHQALTTSTVPGPNCIVRKLRDLPAHEIATPYYLFSAREEDELLPANGCSSSRATASRRARSRTTANRSASSPPSGLDAARTKTILLVLFDSGVRASELCGLRTEDVNWDAQTIVVRDTKGGNERTVSMGTAARSAPNTIKPCRTPSNHAEHHQTMPNTIKQYCSQTRSATCF
jgi:integrase